MILITICYFYILRFTAAFYDGQVSTYELLYGDLTKLENFFVLPFNATKDDTTESPVPEPMEKRRPLGELLEKLERVNQIMAANEHRHDVHDFNAINIELQNLTTRKRYYGGKRYAYDEDDYYKRGIHERKKKLMLLMANIQFVIHTRYKVAIALNLRNVVKADKRYRMGYLFSRLRRLLATMRRTVASAHESRISKYHHNLYTLMRLYQTVARLDVDMRDTAALIRRIYAEKAVVDKLY